MKCSDILENLFLSLPLLSGHHAPGSQPYNLLKQVSRKEIEDLFSEKEPQSIDFKPFGELVFPYQSMGAVDSLNLFDLDELIIFSFYWANRKRYRRVLDIGANIGLHSILLNKCGYEIRAYEPDPTHFNILKQNLAYNNCSSVQPFNSAVSTVAGEKQFTRVLGNTTSSHLTGSKADPYGDLETFPVTVVDIASIIGWADLIKLDAEGHEKDIFLATYWEHWRDRDALVEVGSEQNAVAVYDHCQKMGVNLFAQKINWNRVTHVAAMPTSYHDGTLFITCKGEMPWAGEEKDKNE